MAEDEEVDFQTAKGMAESGKCRLVWIGREPADYIAGLLGVDRSLMVQLDPSTLPSAPKEELVRLSGSVLVCYHGVSSLRAVRLLERKGVRAYSMRGGVTSIVGEIF